MHLSVTEIPIKQLVSGTSILATQPLQLRRCHLANSSGTIPMSLTVYSKSFMAIKVCFLAKLQLAINRSSSGVAGQRKNIYT